MKKLLILLAALGCGVTLHAASAAQGSCEAKARDISVGASGAVVLVNEYDPDWGEFLGNGVYYAKVTLKKGHSYTVYSDNADNVSLEAYAWENWEGDVWPPMAGFYDGDVQSGKNVLWMYASDWDEDDQSSWPFYIRLSGSIGRSAVLNVVEGIQTFVAKGLAANPEQITMADGKDKSASRSITEEGSYYFKASLTEGRKYLIRTTGGTAKKPYALRVSSEKDFISEANPEYEKDKNNTALAVYPQASGVFKFIVSGGVKGDTFGFVYRAVPARTPAEHNPAALANGGTKSFRPGPVVADTAFYDAVIDKNLFKVKMEKGDRWVFDAVGADRSVLMRLYDAKGVVLAENETIGNGSRDLRIGYDAAKAGDYFVGVCDPAQPAGAAAVCSKVTLKARKVAKKDAAGVSVPLVPGVKTDDPLEVGTTLEAGTLTETCWSRTFLVAGRAGQGYKLATSFVGDGSSLPLQAELFKLSSSGKETAVELDSDVITPGRSIRFETSVTATYAVRISVSNGKGLNFPKFNVHALAYSTTGENLGILTVQMKGAAGQWTLDKEKEKYAGGVSILLSGEHTVKFTTVKNYSVTPRCSTGTVKGASWTGKVKAGKTATVVTGEYGDKFDPKDDVQKGASSLSISNKEKSNTRTLWAQDTADWFKFTAKDGVYNNFRFADRTGDSVMTVTDANGKAVSKEVTSVPFISKFAVPKGTYYVKVTHGKKPAQDGAYSLVASSVNVGAIKFAKTAVKVKDNAGQVVLTVNRTAKEGKVRVRWETVNGSAKAGTDYVKKSGELVWKSGEKDKKEITITILPDLVPTYTGKDKTFKVRLTPVAATGADEYPAAFSGGDTATITITESAKKGVDPYKPAKKATGKENDSFCNGTFAGVAVSDGKGSTAGAARLANVSFTAKGKTLSAKVTILGKSYSFSTKDGWKSSEGGVCSTTLVNAKEGLELKVKVTDGKTVSKGDYLTSGGEVAFDFKGGHFEGGLVRDNSKVQAYLDDVVNYVGYYTVALAPQDTEKFGYGYVTLTVDNKGKVKLGGMLADGVTKVSGSSFVAIRKDGSLVIPVFVGKANYCFGGAVRLALAKTAYGDIVPTVDSADDFVWNEDKATLSGAKTAGWKTALTPVGGFYDTVISLQRYYYDNRETLSFDGVPVTLLDNKLTLPKKAKGKTCSDLSFTFKRATGLVSGRLTYKGTASCKVFGVFLLTRDEAAPLDANIEAPGFFTRKVSNKIESVSLSVLSSEN